MEKLTKRDIFQVYDKIKGMAQAAFVKGNYNKSIDYISIAARVAVYFNWMYSDTELEELMEKLSRAVLSGKTKSMPSGTPRRYVFYDFRATDNVCLTQQYLRALMSLDVEILYVPEVWNPLKAQAINSELSNYPKIKIVEPKPGLSPIARIKELYNIINDFQPEKILLQLSPWSAMAVVLFNAFPKVTRYYIDLNDHSFNLGISCTDYAIEFRKRGCTVAIEKRGIPENKVLYLPYYPIITQGKFSGFPEIVTRDKVILLSGGSFYKIYGDNDRYFKILRQLIRENPALIVIYVGIGYDVKFKQFIKDNNLENRIVILNFRKDINEVFQHSDLYLATYPFGGGLMSQYAAVNGKPVLAYNKPDRESDFIESIICDDTDLKITYTDVDELAAEVHKLINDKAYREEKGTLQKNAILTPEEFSQRLAYLLMIKQNPISYSRVKIDHEAFFNRYLERQNNYSRTFKALIISKFKWRSLFLFPKVVYVSLPLFMEFLQSPRKLLRKARESSIVN